MTSGLEMAGYKWVGLSRRTLLPTMELDHSLKGQETPKNLSKNQKGDLRSAVSAGSETRAEPSSWIGSKKHCLVGTR
jgi:hypothetical protein